MFSDPVTLEVECLGDTRHLDSLAERVARRLTQTDGTEVENGERDELSHEGVSRRLNGKRFADTSRWRKNLAWTARGEGGTWPL
jgi:hypothetical protein